MTKSTNNMTIVTAFINNVNVRNDRTLEHYMEYGKHLLNVNLPKIILIQTNGPLETRSLLIIGMAQNQNVLLLSTPWDIELDAKRVFRYYSKKRVKIFDQDGMNKRQKIS